MVCCVALLTVLAQAAAMNLIRNSDLETWDESANMLAHFQLEGSVARKYAGYRDENATYGVALSSQKDTSGAISQLVTPVNQARGKWLRFSFRGRAEDGFQVAKDQLYIKMEFFSEGGKNAMDSAERLIYREIVKDRADLSQNGNQGKAGASVWRTYEFEELLPFNEVDAIRVSVGFKNGSSTQSQYNSFYVDDFQLTQNSVSTDGRIEPKDTPRTSSTSKNRILLGGRWSYQPLVGETVKLPLTVTEANSSRLFYGGSTIFKGCMSSILKKGYMTNVGEVVTSPKAVPDNLVLTFQTNETVLVRLKNVPNHPTAKFPDDYGTQGYNPSYIAEQRMEFTLPTSPKLNPKAIAMTQFNANNALNMGATGFAVNGVIFYNPFDAGMEDASGIMDRCCGHPSPDYAYHYHKYPICVNTPFVDKGMTHSPVIGFALDGHAVYGPYESDGIMAKDLVQNKLNSFNAHSDKERGWHYHVTPGKFPYILGGYLGVAARRIR
jgi:hypothetical protein